MVLSIGAEKTWSRDVLANQKASLLIVNDRGTTRNENVELGLHDDFNYVVRINNNGNDNDDDDDCNNNDK